MFHVSYVGDGPQAGILGVRKVFQGPDGHRQEARAVKTVKVSGWVAKLAWDQTVGGVHCNDVLNRYRLGHSSVPIWWCMVLAEKLIWKPMPGAALHVFRSTSHHRGRRV